MSLSGSPPRARSPSRSPAGMKKLRKAKRASAHPQYKEMIKEALTFLKERNGSSRQKILNYILSNFNLGGASESQINSRLKFALRSGIKHGVLVRNAEGVGVTGKFRLARVTPQKRRRARRAKGRGRKRRRRRRRSSRKVKRSRRRRRRRSPRRKLRRKRRQSRRRKGKARRARAGRRRARSPRRKVRRRRRAVRRRRRARR